MCGISDVPEIRFSLIFFSARRILDLRFVIFRHLLVHLVIVFPVSEKKWNFFFGTLARHFFWTALARRLSFAVKVIREDLLLPSKFELFPVKTHWVIHVWNLRFSFFSVFRHFGDVTVGGRNVGSTSGFVFWVRWRGKSLYVWRRFACFHLLPVWWSLEKWINIFFLKFGVPYLLKTYG